jgi:hypothetical protein
MSSFFNTNTLSIVVSDLTTNKKRIFQSKVAPINHWNNKQQAVAFNVLKATACCLARLKKITLSGI